MNLILSRMMYQKATGASNYRTEPVLVFHKPETRSRTAPDILFTSEASHARAKRQEGEKTITDGVRETIGTDGPIKEPAICKTLDRKAIGGQISQLRKRGEIKSTSEGYVLTEKGKKVLEEKQHTAP
jgi:hypothetical protein